MNPVQQKISCVYKIGVSDVLSSKRQSQQFKVTATKEILGQAVLDGIESAQPTEKLDGTCCQVSFFQGKPWLWARHDRKPNKYGDKKFAQYKKKKQGSGVNDESQDKPFSWDPATDFKEVPPYWVPASRLEVVDGFVVPDKLGHTPGWVPVEETSRQHCWHLSAVDLTSSLALALREDEGNGKDLVLEIVPLSRLNGQTCELIGTNINGNPYGIGNKKQPLHFLVAHGSLSVSCPPPESRDALEAWFNNHVDAGVEGIVWHCQNGELYKLHRHHLNLPWPVESPQLCRRKVKIAVDAGFTEAGDKQEVGASKNHLQEVFVKLTSLGGQVFDSLQHLHNSLFLDAV